MIAFSTLIPLRRNDGSPVSDEVRERIVARLVAEFGPITIEGRVSGYWYDSASNGMKTEESLKVLIGCEWQKASAIEPVLREIGLELGQEAMFLEIHAGGASYIWCSEPPTEADAPAGAPTWPPPRAR